jgi:peptidoglycan/LPS O-acetylase OafA/YrhL
VVRAGPRSQSRIPGVEGVRAIAAGCILIYHCWLYGAGGGERARLGLVNRFVLPQLPLGVMLFFALSGFLLYLPYVSSILKDTKYPDIRRYFRNRVLRIVPAYWVILLATGVLLPAAQIRVSSDSLALGRLTSDPALVVRDATFIQNYLPSSMITGIGPAWSLAVEVVFYVTLPCLAWLAAACARRVEGPRRRSLAAFVPIALLVVIGASGRATAQFLVIPEGGWNPGWDGDWHAVIARSFWAQADLFAFGMALAVVRVNLEQGTIRLPARWRLAAVACAAAAAVSTMLLLDRGVLDKEAYAYQAPMSLACGLLLALVVLPDPQPRRSPLVALLTARPLVAVGLASYSLFLWHEPLIRLLHARGLTMDGTVGFGVNLLVLGSLAGLLSALTYRYVERPALRMKDRARRADRAARSPQLDPSPGAMPDPSVSGTPTVLPATNEQAG